VKPPVTDDVRPSEYPGTHEVKIADVIWAAVFLLRDFCFRKKRSLTGPCIHVVKKSSIYRTEGARSADKKRRGMDLVPDANCILLVVELNIFGSHGMISNDNTTSLIC